MAPCSVRCCTISSMNCNWLALAELLLCLILFAACAAHVRLRLRYAPSAATDPS